VAERPASPGSGTKAIDVSGKTLEKKKRSNLKLERAYFIPEGSTTRAGAAKKGQNGIKIDPSERQAAGEDLGTTREKRAA